ncbi:MAG: pyrroloquinoline quinone precursor peptide PqqA [Steroidobacteraceae bacterium]|nr:pyrroloquinoline quinone precursor peptide PqqA [Steroidobacteraceae bacterium]
MVAAPAPQLRAAVGPHENHDLTIMMIPLGCARRARSIGLEAARLWPPQRRKRIWIMKWETPEAVDFRFGMEITMYVANR